MKRFFFVFLTTLLLVPAAYSFRDVTKGSTLDTQVRSLIERGVLKDGSFLRADQAIPADMFWEMVLSDAGFDPHSATFNTPLPPNVSDTDPLAQFLREAIRRGFIDSTKDFDPNATIKRIDAIQVLVKTKGLLPPRANSKLFLKKVTGTPPAQTGLTAVETAYASHLLENKDISPLKPNSPLSRRDLIRWLYNYSIKGEKRSSINPGSVRVQEAPTTIEREPQAPSQSQSPIRIEPLSPDSSTPGILLQILSSTPQNNNVGDGIRIPNGRILENVFRKIKTQYRFPEELTEEKETEMIEAAVTAMVNALGDKYTTYMEPEKTKSFQEGLEGQFEGIGAYVEMINEKFTITAPITGSPAEKAGIMPGDIVTKVDGVAVAGKSVTDIVSLIKGPAGSKVLLTIERNAISHDITVIRGQITIPSTTLKWEKSVPIIGIHKFTSTTGQDFKKILVEEVLPKKPRGIVLDLRNNPGGYLTSAVEMGEFFLNEKDLIFSVEYKGNKDEYRSSRKGELYGFKNLVILQNKGSASASEIFSSMARDYGIAKIVGTKSHGKGTVQEVDRQANGGTLKLTIAKWLTPKGTWIQEGEESLHGVPVDIEVPDPTIEEKLENIDRQLETAVNEVLRH